MCIVIDIQCLSKVFNYSDNDHKEFEPVLNWIKTGKGKIVYGGTKYLDELAKTGKYLKILTLMKNYNKTITIENSLVDKRQEEIEAVVSPKCDDPHIIAIVDVSGCKLLCSDDSRSFEFVKDKSLYEINKPPGIYSSKKNKSLLTDKYIANCCKPTKKAVKKMTVLLNGMA